MVSFFLLLNHMDELILSTHHNSKGILFIMSFYLYVLSPQESFVAYSCSFS